MAGSGDRRPCPTAMFFSACHRSHSSFPGALGQALGHVLTLCWRVKLVLKGINENFGVWEGADVGTDRDGESADVAQDATATASFPVTAVRGSPRRRPARGRKRACRGRFRQERPQIDSAGDYKDRERENRIAPLPAAHNRASKDPEPGMPDQEGRAIVGREDVGKASGPGPASVVLRWFGRKVGGLGPA
jgi:hypothetical protein